MYFHAIIENNTIAISKKEILQITEFLDEKLIIGKGAFGTVYQVNDFRCPGTAVAVKVLNKVKSNSDF